MLARPIDRWNQTVDRRLVHRDAVAEVLLTEVVPDSGGSFSIGVQWPRGHRVYRPDEQGRADPMLLLETVRQAGLAVSHLGFGVPFGWRSLMLDVGFELLTDDPGARTDIAVTLDCSAVRRRGEHLGSMTVTATFCDGDRLFASGTGSIRWLPGDRYTAVRLRSTGPRRAPRTVADPVQTRDRAPADSLLAAPAGNPLVRRLVVPMGHPVYFDHPLDHVPGMVLVDAAWQATRDLLTADIRLRHCRMSCPSFTELDRDTEVRLTPGTVEVGFDIVQDGRVTAAGTFGLAT